MFWASNSYEDHISNQRYAAGSPSGSYAPSVVRCPEVGVRVRQATEMVRDSVSSCRSPTLRRVKTHSFSILPFRGYFFQTDPS